MEKRVRGFVLWTVAFCKVGFLAGCAKNATNAAKPPTETIEELNVGLVVETTEVI